MLVLALVGKSEFDVGIAESRRNGMTGAENEDSRDRRRADADECCS
jgi:hypothetical protein